uniref:Uncharacterized protein n=1 Tax=Arundo donax TaxID=35708 RepID=A0A0A9AJ25_ARUDO
MRPNPVELDAESTTVHTSRRWIQAYDDGTSQSPGPQPASTCLTSFLQLFAGPCYRFGA